MILGRFGMPFFAEDGGEMGSDFTAGMDEAFGISEEAGTPTEDGHDEQPRDQPETPEETPEPEALENQEEETPEDSPEDNSPAFLMEVAGRRVSVPADAMQALSAALGQDARDIIQKGMTYDQKASREMQILSDYAKAAGQDLPAYLDFLEQSRNEQLILAEAESIRGQYPEGTPDEALFAIAKNTVENRLAQQRQAEQQQAAQRQSMMLQQRQQALADEVRAFQQAHPDIKSAEDVPAEVWERVNAGETLTSAYSAWRLAQAEAEIETLKTQLKTEKKVKSNREQSMGSQGSGQDDNDPFIQGLLGK